MDTVFHDIVFKLAVVNHLMYQESKLAPFQLEEVEAKIGKKLFDGANWTMPEDDMYGMMPEVKAWFEAYEIPTELLEDIEELGWEAGEGIQGEVAPYWDGEDSLFDFTASAARDLHRLPNLKRVIGLFDLDAGDEVVAEFAKKGVELVHPYA